MKNPLYILLLVFTATFSACKHGKATIDRFILVNQTLDFCLESLRDDAEDALGRLKIRVAKEGNTEEGLQLIKRADLIKTQASKLLDKIEKIKKNLKETKGYGINAKTNTANKMNVVIYSSDLEDLEKDLENFMQLLNSKYKDLKRISVKPTETKQDFLDIKDFDKKRLFEVLPLLTQKQIQITTLETNIFEELTVKNEVPKSPPLSFVSVESDIVPLGENYKAHILFVQGLTKSTDEMTCNGVPIPVDKNGVGKVRFKTKDTGWQIWKGSIKYKGKYRDSTFRFEKRYYVMPKMK